MKKVLLSLAAALTLGAYAQTDISVSAVPSPSAGYVFNTTDTVLYEYEVTNEGNTVLNSTDTIFFRLSIDGLVVPLVNGATQNTFYPALRLADATNPALQSSLAPGESVVLGFRLNPFPQAIIDQITNNDVCFDVLLWDVATADWAVESDDNNNLGCNQITEPVGIAEHSSSFTTYPNPVVNEFNIELVEENATITIMDLIGRVLLTENLTNGVNTIDVSMLNSGNYVYSVNIGSEYLGSGKIQK